MQRSVKSNRGDEAAVRVESCSGRSVEVRLLSIQFMPLTVIVVPMKLSTAVE